MEVIIIERRAQDVAESAPATELTDAVEHVDIDIREGRFQRWLALVAAGASLLSGAEVAYEHYRGSYSRRVMYTPVALSVVLAAAGSTGFADRNAATRVLPAVSAITGIDGLLGFYFHIAGIKRKPGGWRLPVTNMVMGPPVFAPLLFIISAYLGFIAGFLRRADDGDASLPRPAHAHHWTRALGAKHEPIDWKQDVREGRFQRQLAAATAIASFLSGFEAWYSHYKSNFRYKAQWTPVIVSPLLSLAATGAVVRPRVAQTWLPALSAIAVLDGSVGFFYHARGVARRPGGLKKLAYNVVYGPPLFAPLLFAAAGSLGLLASLLRREHR